MINNNTVKQFWDKRAKLDLSEEQINFVKGEYAKEKHDTEKRTMLYALNCKGNEYVLDLGGGWGRLALQLYPLVKDIMVVDYCKELIIKGKEKFHYEGIKNVWFVNAPVQNYLAPMRYDLITIAGLLIYMNDKDVSKMIRNISLMTLPHSIIYVKESTATTSKLELNDVYSEALSSKYSSVYRTRAELNELFKEGGFELTAEGDMFAPINHPLNKYKENRQRWYVFKKNQNI